MSKIQEWIGLSSIHYFIYFDFSVLFYFILFIRNKLFDFLSYFCLRDKFLFINRFIIFFICWQFFFENNNNNNFNIFHYLLI